MERLNKNLLIEIALKLDLPEVIKFCRTSKAHNKAVCENRDFWNRKLKKDYGFVSNIPRLEYEETFYLENNQKLFDKFGITSDTPVKAYNELQKKYDEIYKLVDSTDRNFFDAEILSFIIDMGYDRINNMTEFDIELFRLLALYPPSVYGIGLGDNYKVEVLKKLKEINKLREKYSNREEYEFEEP